MERGGGTLRATVLDGADGRSILLFISLPLVSSRIFALRSY